MKKTIVPALVMFLAIPLFASTPGTTAPAPVVQSAPLDSTIMTDFESRLDAVYATQTVLLNMYKEYSDINDATNARSIQIIENVRETLPQLSTEMKSLLSLVDAHGDVIKAKETNLQREKFTYFQRELSPMSEIINLAAPGASDKK
jgi:hypothetical protein